MGFRGECFFVCLQKVGGHSGTHEKKQIFC